MAKKNEYKKMTNAELNIESLKLENAYNKKREEALSIMEKLKELNDEYLLIKEEIKNRRQW